MLESLPDIPSLRLPTTQRKKKFDMLYNRQLVGKLIYPIFPIELGESDFHLSVVCALNYFLVWLLARQHQDYVRFFDPNSI